MRKFLSMIILVVVMFAAGCTSQNATKNFGGETVIELPAKTKFVNVEWSKSDLWIIQRPMRTEEYPETITIKQHSSWGVLSGTIIIKESR
ncbi:hypothetical protein ALO_12536 [Acetonema longum DSM 6540]|uniref:Lipoprotein n=1 Tax=Acetonema longum DSM 6540 TaxID=1009370 RepID=F7NK94_9FIRM|nr:hypothetical protein ALO_12536 [Acetonema longum DSM 6540]